MIKNILKQTMYISLGIGTGCLIFLIYYLVIDLNYGYTCAFLENISGTIKDDFEFVGHVLLLVIILILGSIIYIIFNKKLKNKAFIYFVILTLFSFGNFGVHHALKIGNTPENEILEEILCTKIIDDGMFCEMNNLNQIEYTYLGANGFKMPELPLDINPRIDVLYFRDNFFGEFTLDINVAIPLKQSIDSLKYPKWKLVKTLDNDSLEYNYHLSQM